MNAVAAAPPPSRRIVRGAPSVVRVGSRSAVLRAGLELARPRTPNASLDSSFGSGVHARGVVIGVAALMLVTLRPLSAASPTEPRVAFPLSGVRAEVASLMLGPHDGGDLRLAAVAVPEPDGTRLALWVEIVGADLLAGTTSDDELKAGTSLEAPITVEVHAYALTAERAVAGHGGWGVILDAQHDAVALRSSGLRLSATLAVTSAAASVRVLVRRSDQDTFGLMTVPLRPDAGAAAPIALAVATSANWLDVQGGEPPNLDLRPAALPVWAADAPVRLRLLGADATAAHAVLRVRSLGDDTTVAEVALAPGDEVAPGASWSGHLPWLEAGGYRVDVAMIDAKDRRRWTPAFRVAVVPSDFAASTAVDALTWPTLVVAPGEGGAIDVEGIAAGGAVPRVANPRAGPSSSDRVAQSRAARSRAIQRRAFAAEYRAALEHQAAGHYRRAVAALSTSEAPGHEEARALDILVEAQESVATKLADRDPEALVPVLVLHLSLYEHYVETRAFVRAVYARQRVEAVAVRYAEAVANTVSRDEDHIAARQLAAEALARLGASLLRGNLDSAAHLVLRRATELDPESAFALKHRAMAEALAGAYPAAIEVLDRWVTIDPGVAEGWLRLGVNQRQVGDLDAAARSLRRAADLARAPWRVAVAFQELARVHLDRDRPGDALRVLDEGLARLPNQRRLALQRAHALDRLGDHARAREWIASLPARAPRGGHPRLRYGRVAPSRGPAGGRLPRASTARLPALAAALETLGGRSNRPRARRP